MKGKGIVIILLILMIASKYTHFIKISNWYIFGGFMALLIMIYISVHQKNKERDTPKPVYFAKP
jgi:hypothetical protein